MKTIYYDLLLVLLVVGCQDSVSMTENNRIVFYTSSNSYSSTDSIQVIIENHTQSDFGIGLRCGRYIEMSYQKKEDSTWSQNFRFR